jgi:hypothetical protein
LKDAVASPLSSETEPLALSIDFPPRFAARPVRSVAH